MTRRLHRAYLLAIEVTLCGYTGLRHTGLRRQSTGVRSHKTSTRYRAIVGVRTLMAEKGCKSRTCDLSLVVQASVVAGERCGYPPPREV